MTRFLLLPLLLAASACSTTAYLPANSDEVATTASVLDFYDYGDVPTFVFDGVTIDRTPACRVDDLADIEALHTDEAKLVLRDRELPLAC